MKYIRNELGILKITNIDKYTVSYENNKYAGTMDIERLSKYKQTDTIEELCDTTVKIFDDGFTIVGDDLTTKEGHYVLYGAIWTDKGLIYVAKMNEKGCLELL